MSGESVADPKGSTPRKRVNVRTPEVMNRVTAEVEQHYRSKLVERIREKDGKLTMGNTTVVLARQFGFCYGVERAIDLAYATREVFGDKRIYLLGEIIHNPEVNRQLAEMGVESVERQEWRGLIDQLTPEDVVIVPAFGTEISLMSSIREKGCHLVDTTCGDVMSVWKRVKKYASTGRTSIIHGKVSHEETRATSSRALGRKGDGHFLVILTLEDVDYVGEYIRGKGDREEFLEKFAGAYSEGFDPELHLARVGVANQTTMLKSETEEMQRRLEVAVRDRYGEKEASERFESFDTICGATQERQDALFTMLEQPLDLLLVVGGYNSSNTGHLVEIGEQQLPSFFIRDASCLSSLGEILHFDLESKTEKRSYSEKFFGDDLVTVGVTAGASCPNNLIEETILRIFELRGIDASQWSES